MDWGLFASVVIPIYLAIGLVMAVACWWAWRSPYLTIFDILLNGLIMFFAWPFGLVYLLILKD